MAPVYIGIDSGTWTTKAVVIDADAGLLGSRVERTAADLAGAADRALTGALETAGIERGECAAIWATGFGRANIPFADDTRTELDCHARGVRHHVEGAVTIVDIGGQDAKVIRLDERGRRISHKMNRKCAAGTGSFLEEMALRLGVPIEGFHELASGFTEELELGSFCTVFTGTEVLTSIRQGRNPADLARASYRSVVRRVLEMDVFEGRIAATGGVVAHHPVVVEMMEEAFGSTVFVPPHPQEMGAFGAALACRHEIGSVRKDDTP
jgi:predicted CoA-substrate-specific enzyme activase